MQDTRLTVRPQEKDGSEPSSRVQAYMVAGLLKSAPDEGKLLTELTEISSRVRVSVALYYK